MSRECQTAQRRRSKLAVRCATADAHPDGIPTDASSTWARSRDASGGAAMEDSGTEYLPASKGSWMTIRIPSASCRGTAVCHASQSRQEVSREHTAAWKALSWTK